MEKEIEAALRQSGLAEQGRELLRLEQAQKQAAERDAALRKTKTDSLAQIANDTQKKIALLKGAYIERGELAKIAMDCIVAYVERETKLRGEIDAVRAEFVGAMAKEHGDQDTNKRFAELVRAAGLGAHEGYCLPGAKNGNERTALACLMLIIQHRIANGVLKKCDNDVKIC